MVNADKYSGVGRGQGLKTHTQNFDLLKIRTKSLKIHANFVKIWAKSLKIFTKSLKMWSNSLKMWAKWRPTLFDLKKWPPMFAKSHEDLFLEVIP